MAEKTIVLKFGSSVLSSRAELPKAVHEIYRWYRDGWRVVAVVSALDDTTENLLAEARDLSVEPEPFATAELLATGERHSAALVGIALDRAGIKARVVDPREIDFATTGSPLDSEPISVDRVVLDKLLSEYRVLVVPGFFGYGTDGRLRLLGRGGSDFSAVFLADALEASRCRLIKDVDGVYEHDPAVASSTPTRRFATLGYAKAIECAAQLIQPKAVRFLEHRAAKAEVAGLASSYESIVGPTGNEVVDGRRATPLRVLLLGLGTVGFGVYQRLVSQPDRFQVVGAFVRDRQKYVERGIDPSLLLTSREELDGVTADVVVDMLPGLEPSQSLIRRYLYDGVRVISANKVVVAEGGKQSLSYSAAVGGGAPMIEALRREVSQGQIRAIAGVVNGTCNYILDRCAEGAAFDDAVKAAQVAGFAEANPDEDLSGRDAARKLRILARIAFGRDPDAIEIRPLNAATLARRAIARHPNESLRHVARAWNLGRRIFGQVELEAVPNEEPLSSTTREWNQLVITRANGDEITVTGRGAGRWPTTEAVMADLFEVVRAKAGLSDSV